MDFKYINHILKTNWLLNETQIYNLLWDLSDEIFNQVYDNRQNYPKMVHQIIEPRDFVFPVKKKLRVIELTDDLWNSLKIEEQRRKEYMIHQQWLKYCQNLPDRDWTPIDEHCDAVYEELSNARKELDGYRQTKSAKYIAPGSRPRQDVNEEKLIQKIEYLKNEFERAKAEVEKADLAYEKNAESLFKQKMRKL